MIFPMAAPAASPSPTPAPFFPLLLWIGLQLFALGAALVHVAPWPNPPASLDRLALPEMLVVQCLASALLFPLILRTPRLAALVILSAWPFCQLAAFVSSTPAPRWIAAGGALSLWLIGLAAWRSVLRTRALQQIGLALAAALTLGGPVLLYLGVEFGPRPAPVIPWSSAAAMGPILSCLAPLQPGAIRAGWIFLLIHLALGIGAAAMAGFRRARRRG
jgi:hypothetical protein